MEKKKILIVGAKGMLGQDLVKVFGQDENYQVLAWDKEEIDITSLEKSKEKISREQPSLIINAAAYNNVDKAEEIDAEFNLAMAINANGPANLAQIAKELDIAFVHYVSDYIFDGVKGEYKEDDSASPISRYGQSKALGEEKILATEGKNYLIRTSKLFGKPAKSKSAKKSFFQTMLDLSDQHEQLKVVDSERSCFTYTPDLAQATKVLWEKNYAYGIYHLVNEGAVTWYQGLRYLFELLNITDVELIPVTPSEFPRPAKRPASSVLLNTKFPKLRRYEEALKDWAKSLQGLS